MVAVVGSYNMSFMSDKDAPAVGKDMPPHISEGAFLAPLRGQEGRRSYWLNALALLRNFIIEKNPICVGLQEMNITAEESDRGTDAVKNMLATIDNKYKLISGKVVTNDAGIAIIYDSDRLGDVTHNETFDNINQANGPGPKGGRPIIYAITEKEGKKYLLISMHGAQDGSPPRRLNKDFFNEYMTTNNKEFLEREIPRLVPIDEMSQVFVMGDFNDRYDAIKEFKFSDKVTVKYNGRAPKSCCHNWDSSCPDLADDGVTSLIEKDFGDDYKTCTVPPVVFDKDTGKIPLDARGAIKNYRYAGDKVFGRIPISDIEIYKQAERQGISTESDHELVYATFSLAAAGGGRRRSKSRRQSRKVRHQKKRQSRRRR